MQAVLLDQQSQPLHAMTRISVIAPFFTPTDEQERPGGSTTQHENRGYGRLGSGKNYKHKLLALHRDDSEGSDHRLSSEFLDVQTWTLRLQHRTIQSKTDRTEGHGSRIQWSNSDTNAQRLQEIGELCCDNRLVMIQQLA